MGRRPLPEKVIFCIHPDNADTVFAIFPHLPGNNDPKTMLSYEHVGQHGQAHISYVDECYVAKDPAQYADLKKELEGIGYELDIQDYTGYADELARMRAIQRA